MSSLYKFYSLEEYFRYAYFKIPKKSIYNFEIEGKSECKTFTLLIPAFKEQSVIQNLLNLFQNLTIKTINTKFY